MLAGTTPLTATSGGGLNALIGDIRKLTAAISTAGGGGGQIWFVASPATARN